MIYVHIYAYIHTYTYVHVQGEVIDPYVKVDIFGVPADEKSETTSYVEDNG